MAGDRCRRDGEGDGNRDRGRYSGASTEGDLAGIGAAAKAPV